MRKTTETPVRHPLLAVRAAQRRRQPAFRRQDSPKRKKLKKGWRKPRGMHSKMRRHLRGYRKSVNPGYRAPRAVRGLLRNGMQSVRVATLAELERLQTGQAACLARTIGRRTRLALLKRAAEKKIRLVQMKDAAAWILDMEKSFAGQKQRKMEKKEEPLRDSPSFIRPEDAVKDSSGPGASPSASDEEKKGQEKRELDKLLTKKA